MSPVVLKRLLHGLEHGAGVALGHEGPQCNARGPLWLRWRGRQVDRHGPGMAIAGKAGGVQELLARCILAMAPCPEGHPRLRRRQGDKILRAFFGKGQQIAANAPAPIAGMDTRLKTHMYVLKALNHRVPHNPPIQRDNNPGVGLRVKLLIPPVRAQLIGRAIGHTAIGHVADVEHLTNGLKLFFARHTDYHVRG
ncbi:MAG TPA: hypothetical protein VFN35_28550 [Ktedonobacteraceae bacterium]|nr:hypothetical protein [Ktedonobacteraceae bacterium]